MEEGESVSLPRRAPLTARSRGLSQLVEVSDLEEDARKSAAEERGGSWRWIWGCHSGASGGGRPVESFGGRDMIGCIVVTSYTEYRCRGVQVREDAVDMQDISAGRSQDGEPQASPQLQSLGRRAS